MIPKILHFIWIGSPVPPKYIDNVLQFVLYNKPNGYECKLWVDRDTPPLQGVTISNVSSLNLINYDLYRKESNYGAKADILRYEIVFQEGGIYNDIDAICIKPFDDLFTKAFVSPTYEPWNNLTNAVFGFPANSKFLEFVINALRRTSNIDDVASRTGPIFFTNCFTEWSPKLGSESWYSYCQRQHSVQMIHQDLLVFPRRTWSISRQIGYTYHLNDSNWSNRAKINVEPKVSFCTAIKNRFSHISQTLPQNIADGGSNVEFVVVDYTSDDSLSSWIKPYATNGLVNYYRVDGQKYWRNSHAKNICAWAAQGGIICNVDADNFIGPGFTDYLLEFYRRFNGVITAPPAVEGVTGRIACKRKDFISLGGYNENFIFGWGCEDIDLVARARGSGFAINYIDKQFLKHIPHDNAARGCHGEIQDIWVSNRKSLDLMEASLREKKYIANVGNTWAYAHLKKNFSVNMVSGFLRLVNAC